MFHKQREDPFFRIPTPVLFAHRGGAGEEPESTCRAFRHAALAAGVDVFEIDVQASKDPEIVVWHGPLLENVHNGTRLFGKRDIRDLTFHEELEERAWVVHPDFPGELEKSPDRLLLTLEEFLVQLELLEKELEDKGRPRTLHLNIELKKGHGIDREWNPLWDRLFRLLDSQPERRRIILASADHRLLSAIRRQMGERGGRTYPTNLSYREQLSFRHLMAPTFTSMRFTAGILFSRAEDPPEGPYLFITYYKLASKKLIKNVISDQRAFYVFLTAFGPFLPSADDRKDSELEGILHKLLKAGVDGIMTDYPCKVARLLRNSGVRKDIGEFQETG